LWCLSVTAERAEAKNRETQKVHEEFRMGLRTGEDVGMPFSQTYYHRATFLQSCTFCCLPFFPCLPTPPEWPGSGGNYSKSMSVFFLVDICPLFVAIASASFGLTFLQFARLPSSKSGHSIGYRRRYWPMIVTWIATWTDTFSAEIKILVGCTTELWQLHSNLSRNMCIAYRT
jgi:hypothetical protein